MSQFSKQPEDGAVSLFAVHSMGRKLIKVTLQVNRHQLAIELDTACCIYMLIVSLIIFKTHFNY